MPKDYDLSYYDYEWDIRETDDMIYGDTTMDNFSMEEYLRFIDVPDKVINIDKDG